MIKINGKEFPSIMVQELTRGFKIEEGSNSGYVLDGTHRRDITGTYLSYTMVLDSSFAGLAEYDEFFETISNPVESLTVEFPYGQSVYTFEAEVTDGEDSLILHEDDYNLWQDLSITFTAQKPHRRPAE